MFICKNHHIPGKDKSGSRGRNDGRMKKEQPTPTQPQSEPIPSPTIVTSATLSSKIETVADETPNKTQEKTPKNDRKD